MEAELMMYFEPEPSPAIAYLMELAQLKESAALLMNLNVVRMAVGVPILTITVSFASGKESLFMFTVIVVEVKPAKNGHRRSSNTVINSSFRQILQKTLFFKIYFV